MSTYFPQLPPEAFTVWIVGKNGEKPDGMPSEKEFDRFSEIQIIRAKLQDKIGGICKLSNPKNRIVDGRLVQMFYNGAMSLEEFEKETIKKWGISI